MKQSENTMLLIEEGKFKGRRLLIPTKDLNKEIHYALVEKGVMMGSPHFSMACLIHETFGSDQGCDECNKAGDALAPAVV